MSRLRRNITGKFGSKVIWAVFNIRSLSEAFLEKMTKKEAYKTNMAIKIPLKMI